MPETDPELKGAINNVWLEKAKTKMRTRICTNLQMIVDGHFSEDELTLALTSEELPLVIVEDKALRDIVESGDTDAWNEHVATHPEISTRAESEYRFSLARLAAIDRQAVAAYPDLSQAEAIEAVLEARSEEIAEEARFSQIILGAAARNGFAV